MVPGESILSPNDALRVIVLGRKRILFFFAETRALRERKLRQGRRRCIVALW